jgi:hypothetical protein
MEERIRNFIIQTNMGAVRLQAGTILIESDGILSLITNHKTVACFKNWLYFLVEEQENKI